MSNIALIESDIPMDMLLEEIIAGALRVQQDPSRDNKLVLANLNVIYMHKLINENKEVSSDTGK